MMMELHDLKCEPLMAGNKLQVKRIEKFLKEKGPQTTLEIVHHINEITVHGSTSNTIGNILARNSKFQKVGFHQSGRGISHTGFSQSGARNAIWDLTHSP